MTHISFWGGVGVVGSSKVLIEEAGWRVLLDLGLDFNPIPPLFRGRVMPRTDQILADRLKAGCAPQIPYLYRPDALRGVDLPGGSDQKTALFLSHAHPDHMGLTGWVDPSIPIFASPETQAIMTALQNAGLGVEGYAPRVQPLPESTPLAFGPFRVSRYPIDHDVPGSSAYIVATSAGAIAYTGDLRLHGSHPDWVQAFVQAARGCHALIIEGTLLNQAHQEPLESEMEHQLDQYLAITSGLILLSLNPVNLERVKTFVTKTRERGRTILFPLEQARFLEEMGLQHIEVQEESTLKRIHHNPQRYLVQLPVTGFPRLLDLPVGAESLYLYSNGEPYGPSDPDWTTLMDWLHYTQIPFRSLSSTGHASASALHQIVRDIAPTLVFPIHTATPEALRPPVGTKRVLPVRGDPGFDLGHGFGD